jgi:Tfp pilus assembly protein PilE
MMNFRFSIFDLRFPSGKDHRGTKTRRSNGFTVIELIMIVAIIGVLCIMSIPRIGSFGKNQAHIAARRIVADMRYTRRLAITNAQDYTVEFSPSGGPYTEYCILKGAAQVGETRQIPTGVTCSGTEQFTFESLGNALSDGTSSDGMVSLVAGSDQYDVNVIAITGRAY